MNELKQIREACGGVINEAKVDDKRVDQVVDVIANHTKYNDHIGAYVKISQFLDQLKSNKKGMTNILKSIQVIQSFEKSLPPKLKDYRYEKYQELMALVKKALTDEQYKKIYGAT